VTPLKGRYRTALRAAISAESKAYGFTLVIWGTGALAIGLRGTPRAGDAIAYVGGALTSMALVVLLSFGGPTATWTSTELRRLAWGAIHVASVGAALGSGWAVADIVTTKWIAFFGAGAAAALVYQLALAFEVAVTSEQEADDSRG
jgi:hypothetical protein